MWALGVVLSVSIASSAACAPAATQAKADGSVLPVIVRVVPATGPAGMAYPLRVTIEGRHFADSANTVTFGPVSIKGLPSGEDGTRIVLFLPKEVPATGEVPPAPLLPGKYSITVTTAAGESNAFSFQLTPEPGAGS